MYCKYFGLKSRRQGIIECTDVCFTTADMRVYGKLRIEHLAGSTNGYFERDPVSCGSDRLVIIDTLGRNPSRNGCDGCFVWLNKRVDLQSIFDDFIFLAS